MSRSPLFDMFDNEDPMAQPWDYGDPFAAVPVRRGQQQRISDIMPEETKAGWLRYLANVGTSGLSQAAHIFDTPGSMVRGFLSGGLSKGASALTDSGEERVSGRDLLRQYGLIGREDNWVNFLGGLTTEVLTDPLTFMNPLAILGRGAPTAAGKAVSAAGLWRDAPLAAARRGPGLPPMGVREFTRASTPASAINAAADPAEALKAWMVQAKRFGVDPEQLDVPLAGLMNVGIPGTNFGTTFSGGQAGDMLARGLDSFGEFTKRAPVIGPITRTSAALFSPSVGGIGSLNRDMDLTNNMQTAARFAARNLRDADEATNALRTGQQFRAVNAAVPESAVINGVQQQIPAELRDFNNQRFQNVLNDYLESPQVFGPELKENYIKDAAGELLRPQTMRLGSGNEIADWVLQNVPEFRAVRDDFADLPIRERLAAQELGRATTEWRSATGNAGFVPRQIRTWDRPMSPVRPNAATWQERAWGRGSRPLGVVDNFDRARKDYTDIPGQMKTWRELTGNAIPQVPNSQPIDAADLQARLINAPNLSADSAIKSARDIMADAFRTIGRENPYQHVINKAQNLADNILLKKQLAEANRRLPALSKKLSIDDLRAMDPAVRLQFGTPNAAQVNSIMKKASEQVDRMHIDAADLIRGLDTQFAKNNIGAFDSPAWDNVMTYERGQNRANANATELLYQLGQNIQDLPASSQIGGTSIPLNQALVQLQMSPTAASAALGVAPTARASTSINKQVVDALKMLSPQSQLAAPETSLVNAYDNFLNSFKVMALAKPAYHVRNLYSGAVNAMTHEAFNPLDMYAGFRASQGNYDALVNRLAKAPGYENLTREQQLSKYMEASGGQRMSGGMPATEVGAPPGSDSMYLGGGVDTVSPAFYNPQRTKLQALSDFFSMRGVGVTGPAPTRNPNFILAANDYVGNKTEDALRHGVFLNQLRKGVDPTAAGDLSRMSNVDYSGANFTDFERKYMKRLFPFYSFQKGILPSVADNILYRPGGVQGQLTRAIARGSEPGEDSFLPEYMRKSAAIPLPPALGGTTKEGLQSYLTSIDLPWEGTYGFIPTGVSASDAAQNLLMNIMGQTSPLLKYGIESTTNRQLYTGRELSDLYSTMEQSLGPTGRTLENLIANLPGGSTGLSLYRQAVDNRLTPVDKYAKMLFNLTAGVKRKDVDMEKVRRMAARDTLTKLLEETPGIKKYENLTIPDDVLRTLPRRQAQMYLLYKTIQSEAARRANERKKAAALDPMQLMDFVNQA